MDCSRSFSKIIALAIILFTSSVLASPSPLDLEPGSELRPLIERYSTDANGIRQFYWIRSSERRLSRLDEFYDEWEQRLAAVDFDGLTQAGKVDYVLMETDIEYQQHLVAEQRRKMAAISEFVPFLAAATDLEARRWSMEPVEGREAAVVVDRVTQQVKAAQAAISDQMKSEKDVSKVLARRSVGVIDEVAEGLKRWFEFNNGYKPEFGWWVSQPFEAAQEALEGYKAFLRKDVMGIVEGEDEPLIGDPIGREAIEADLRSEVIQLSPEELMAIAEQDLAWSRQQMLAASEEMGFGDDWRAALNQVKNDHVAPGEQDLQVRAVAEEAIAFLDDNSLVTIPPLARETWRLEMIPAERQKFFPFGYYGGQHMGVAYPTDGMDHSSKIESMRGNNRHFVRNVTQHELIPGHHLQGFMAQRHHTYRRPFGTPFYGEGWALYWEMVLYDMGFPRTAEERIGMLVWRMHRGARIIVSLGFHLGDMTPEEMIDFLVDIGLERDGAVGEVRRYITGDYSPLYQCAYMIGGLQIREMADSILANGSMTPRELHDAILRQNSLPIELLRAALTGTELQPNYRANWRFGWTEPRDMRPAE